VLGARHPEPEILTRLLPGPKVSALKTVCSHLKAEILQVSTKEMGPEIQLIGRLKSQRDYIDKSKFDPLDNDQAGEGCLSAAEKVWLDFR